MNKLEFTKAVIEMSKMDIHPTEAYVNWWFKDIDNRKYRLTLAGYTAFKKIVPFYKFNTNMVNSGGNLLQLGKLNSPWFLKRVNYHKIEIYIFSSKIAMTAKLYGDFDKYIQTLQ